MDLYLDVNIQRVLEPLLDLKFEECGKESSHVLSKAQAQMETVIIDSEQWTKDKRYLYYEDRIALPREGVPSVMKWSHTMQGHLGAKESLLAFNKWFYTTMNAKETLETMQSLTHACPSKASKQSDVRDRGPYNSLPIPYCRNSVMYVDFVAQKKFGGYNNVLVVTCTLTRYTRVFPFGTRCTSEDVVETLVETQFKDCAAPKEMSSDEDVLLAMCERVVQESTKSTERGCSHWDTLYSHQQPSM